MASRGQSLAVPYVAWNTALNAGQTGDAGNQTIKLAKCTGGTVTVATATNSPVEVDSTNAKGTYYIILTSAEATNDSVTVCGVSSTSSVSIMPFSVNFEQLPTAAPGTASTGLPLLNASGNVPTPLTGDAYGQLNALIPHAFTYDANNLPKVDLVDIAGNASAGAAGYVGVDWSAINAPTSTVSLSHTSVGTLTGITGVSFPSNFGSLVISAAGVANANAVQIAGNSTAATGATITFPASVGNSTFATGGTIALATTVSTVTAAVVLPTGTGAGQINLSGGAVALQGNQTVNATQWGGAAVTGMPMPTYVQPTGFLAATFPASVGNSTFGGNLTGNQAFNLTGNITGNLSGNVTVGGYATGQDPASLLTGNSTYLGAIATAVWTSATRTLSSFGALVSSIAAAILKTPANPLNTDSNGNVSANNLPANYLSGAEQTQLATAASGSWYTAPNVPTAGNISSAVWGYENGNATTASQLAAAGSGGGGLAGPSGVTLTFHDANGAPVPNVAFTVIGQGPGQGNVTGVASFGLNNGNYTVVGAATSGTLFEPYALEVSGNTTGTITGTAITIPTASNPGQTIGVLTTYDGQGNIVSGIPIVFAFYSDDGSVGTSSKTASFTATSSGTSVNNLQATFAQDTMYTAQRGSGRVVTFTTPSTSEGFLLPEVLGAP